MGNVINKNMQQSEIKQILNDNGIETPKGWDIVLWMLFNTYKTDTAEVIGYGERAELVFK